MNQRKVILFNSQTSKKDEYTTDAETWGQLKRIIGGSIGDKTCVLSGSKHILGIDDAALPAESFTVFVYPKESKGGMAKRPVKKAKKVAKKKPAKKAKAKPAKKAGKKKSSKKSTKVKEAVGSVVSSVEQAKVDNEAQMLKEAAEINRGLKGFR